MLIGSRVIIPESLKPRVLEMLHEDHVGIVRSKMLARSIVWWPNMNNEIEFLISKCRICQLSQNQSKEANLISWPVAGGVWHRVHIDFFQ